MKLNDSNSEYYIEQYKLGLSRDQVREKLSVIGEQARLEMLNILKEINLYGIWKYEEIEKFDTPVPVIYKYPMGIFGDIDKYIASNIGVSQRISALEYQIDAIPRESYKELELLVGYYKQEFTTNKVKQFDEDYNKIALDALISINRVWALIEQLYTWRWATSPDFRERYYNDEIYSLVHDRYNYMKEVRNEIYTQATLEHKTSSRWSSEKTAYTIVQSYYNDAIFQYRSEWLGKESIDIYIPRKRVAIEYQGEQHFHEVSIFGGKEGFDETQRRDRLKRKLCHEQGIRLLEWKFSDPLTEDWFKTELIKKIERKD